MKKEYLAPKAEKMDFEYKEAVVASEGIKCRNTTYYTEWNPTVNCKDRIIHEEVADI